MFWLIILNTVKIKANAFPSSSSSTWLQGISNRTVHFSHSPEKSYATHAHSKTLNLYTKDKKRKTALLIKHRFLDNHHIGCFAATLNQVIDMKLVNSFDYQLVIFPAKIPNICWF